VPVKLANRSESILSSIPPHLVPVSYHWRAEDNAVIFDGLRTRLPGGVEPGETPDMQASVQAPQKPDRYRLLILVQEGCCWCDDIAKGTQAGAEITMVMTYLDLTASWPRLFVTFTCYLVSVLAPT
jgi:hypothetical protein